MLKDAAGKEIHPDDVNSIVRCNMLQDVNYRPYCGNNIARDKIGGCHNPRMVWSNNINQNVCPYCGMTTTYPADFIVRYKDAHGLN